MAVFATYFARFRGIKIEGDINVFGAFLKELENIDFVAPREIKPLDDELKILEKRGILKLREIAEFIKIVHYFLYLKKLNTQNAPRIHAWLEKIEIPQEVFELASGFELNNDRLNLKNGVYEELDRVNLSISRAKLELQKQLEKILQKRALSEYFIDRSVHFVDSKECILLKGGFDKVIDARVIERTSAGYFYVFPSALVSSSDKIARLSDEREKIIFQIEREISLKFFKNLFFLRFINREFERFDALSARICFAKDRNLNFVFPRQDSNKTIVLRDFCHPMLKNPIPCDVDFERDILLVTGANAGGKTMLLKSILSAALLSKFLIPFKINANQSKISYFKKIYIIANDPQSAKNDISTFAGRMLEFKKLIGERDLLLGIDEIELGTDANEASALFFALLEHLQGARSKIVATTHHKLLASLLANNSGVELLAALYDERAKVPKYRFLRGCIGKSYAFESAIRYGIPISIIARAREVYGEGEQLNELIEKVSLLQTKLSDKERELDVLIAQNCARSEELKRAQVAQNEEFNARKLKLEATYNDALGELKAVLKKEDSKEIHRFLNKQHESFKSIKPPNVNENRDFKKGNRVKYGNKSGVIVNISAHNALVELDSGAKLKIDISRLQSAPQAEIQRIEVAKTAHTCNVSLDLHGKRAQEALDELEQYISDCLLAGFDEVIIYHGIGSGVLARVVREFLEQHPKVKSFEDAPANLGGFGAKIVRF